MNKYILLAPALFCAAYAVGQQSSAQLKLEDLERMALAASPSLQHSAAGVRAAESRAKQASLYPNPVIGASGDHNSAATGMRGGLFGGFVEQRIVTAGKLSLSRRAGEQQTAAATQMQEAERLRVLVAIRTLYYEALGAQLLLEVRQELAQTAARTAQTAKETANLGRLDRPDVLAAEVETQRAELSVALARNALDRTWREIAAFVGQPALRQTALDGDLEKLPAVDAGALAKIYDANPELRATLNSAASANVLVDRARVEKYPDILVRGGVRYNRELAPATSSGPASPLGPEGFFDIGVQIPLFNRNQGSLAAARAEAEQARLETDRRKQQLARKFAAVYREYQDSAAAASRYRDQMIPAATQAYEMYTSNFGNMVATYSQVLMTQRNLIQLREEYITALVTAWRSAVEIDGLLVME
jgi:outer membrane protein, heavy metal efflux system